MKKRIIPVILLIIAVAVIYCVGSVRKRSAQQKDAFVESVSPAKEGNSDDLPSSEEEKELLNRVAEDQKTVEQGNIFPIGDYQVFGGFGYKVLDFHMYDSYEELVENVENYNTENEKFSPDLFGDVCSYAYVKIQITNDAVAAKRKYQHVSGIMLAPNGDTTIASKPDLHFDSGGEPFYVDGNREMQPGETITLQWAFMCHYYDGDTGERCRIKDITSSTEYYIQIEGEMSAEYYPHKLADDKKNIYFKCESQEGEESE